MEPDGYSVEFKSDSYVKVKRGNNAGTTAQRFQREQRYVGGLNEAQVKEIEQGWIALVAKVTGRG